MKKTPQQTETRENTAAKGKRRKAPQQPVFPSTTHQAPAQKSAGEVRTESAGIENPTARGNMKKTPHQYET